MRQFLFCVLLFLPILTVVSCGDTDDGFGKIEEPCDQDGEKRGQNRVVTITEPPVDCVKGSNEFGFKMFADVYAANADNPSGVIFSPLSSQMLKGLMISQMNDWGKRNIDIRKELLLDWSFNDYFKSVTSRFSDMESETLSFGLSNLAMSYLREEFPDDMKTIFEDIYGVDFLEFDDSLSPGERPGDIWAKRKSGGLVDTLPHDNKIPGYSAYFLANLSFVKGSLKSAGPLVYEDEEYSSCSLPFSDERLTLTVLLPKGGNSVKDLVGSMTSDEWNRILASSTKRNIGVTVPDLSQGFVLNVFYDYLKDDFKNLYANSANRYRHDLVIYIPRYFFINISMTSRIQLSGVSSADPSNPKDLVVQGPFLYVISESDTGLVLFMGTKV